MNLFYFAVTACKPTGGGFLGFPTWYKYMSGIQSETIDSTGAKKDVCTPHIAQISDVWLIAMAIIDMLLRIAALAAIVLVIYGAVMLMTSQGEPDKVNKGRQTILNAVGGLVICVVAITIVTYVGGRIN